MLTNALNNDFVKGAVVGVGLCAVGFYVYKKNEEKVDDFLRAQGIDMPTPATKDFYTMSLEELMQTKETIEDIIAEKEMQEEQAVSCCCSSDCEAEELDA